MRLFVWNDVFLPKLLEKLENVPKDRLLQPKIRFEKKPRREWIILASGKRVRARPNALKALKEKREKQLLWQIRRDLEAKNSFLGNRRVPNKLGDMIMSESNASIEKFTHSENPLKSTHCRFCNSAGCGKCMWTGIRPLACPNCGNYVHLDVCSVCKTRVRKYVPKEPKRGSYLQSTVDSKQTVSRGINTPLSVPIPRKDPITGKLVFTIPKRPKGSKTGQLVGGGVNTTRVYDPEARASLVWDFRDPNPKEGPSFSASGADAPKWSVDEQVAHMFVFCELYTTGVSRPILVKRAFTSAKQFIQTEKTNRFLVDQETPGLNADLFNRYLPKFAGKYIKVDADLEFQGFLVQNAIWIDTIVSARKAYESNLDDSFERLVDEFLLRESLHGVDVWEKPKKSPNYLGNREI
jgi:Fe-S-cluster containining protein